MAYCSKNVLTIIIIYYIIYLGIMSIRFCKKGVLFMRKLLKEHTKAVIAVAAALALLITTITICMINVQRKGSRLSANEVRDIVTQLPASIGIQIHDADVPLAGNVDNEYLSRYDTNQASLGYVNFNNRDWSSYRSPYATANMTKAQKTFYDRIDAVAQKFMSDPAVDAVYLKDYGFYATNSIQYSDLGLTKTDAYRLYQYYLYNNAQYYFLRPKCLRTSTSICMGIYDDFANGVARAETTEKMFNIIDGWVTQCTDDEVTAHDIEHSVHDLICDFVSYSSGTYDQSIYSTVMFGKTVCTGYAGAFSVVCNKAGIDVCVGISDSHVWNIIYLDGEWYAIDLTWNDSLHGDYIFNTTAAGSKKFDSSNEHTYGTDWISLYPALAEKDYVVSGISGSLSAPDNIVVKESDSSLSVTWDRVQDAATYQVDVYSSGTLVTSAPVFTNSVNITNVKLYDDLLIKIQAIPKEGSSIHASSWSEYQFTQSSVSAPYNIKTDTSVDGSVTVYWDSRVSNASYEVQILSNKDSSVLVSSTINTKVVVLTNMKGKTYNCRIRAVKTIDGQKVYSDWTSFKAGSTSGSQPVPSAPSSSSSSSQATSPASSSTSSVKPVQSSSSSSAKPVSSSSSVQTPQPVQSSSSSSVTEPPVDPVYTEPFSVGNVSGLTVEKLGTARYEVKWSKAKNASSYDVRVNAVDDPDIIWASASVSVTKINLNSIYESDDYYVFVRAVGVDNGRTYYSDWIRYKIDKVVQPEPSYDPVYTEESSYSEIPDTNSEPYVPDNSFYITAPDIYSIQPLGNEKVDVYWLDGFNAQKYEVICSRTDDVNDSSAVRVHKTLTSTCARFINVHPDEDYYVFIRSVAVSNGQTYYSDWTSVKIN